MGLAEDRERARRLATRFVALAIMLAGITLLTLAIALTWIGGPKFLFLTIIILILGLLLTAIGFFFQLVPIRLEELATQKRERDAATHHPRNND